MFTHMENVSLLLGRHRHLLLSKSSEFAHQPIRIPKAQPINKSPHAFAHLVNSYKIVLPCSIIIQSCSFDYRINKPFICSHCVICVSCSVHLISTFYVCKGSWAFISNYSQINKVGKPDLAWWRHLTKTTRCISLQSLQCGLCHERFFTELKKVLNTIACLKAFW